MQEKKVLRRKFSPDESTSIFLFRSDNERFSDRATCAAQTIQPLGLLLAVEDTKHALGEGLQLILSGVDRDGRNPFQIAG